MGEPYALEASTTMSVQVDLNNLVYLGPLAHHCSCFSEF